MADEPNAGTPIHGVDPQLPTPSRPVSVRKVAANRRNAQHSTGPRTAAGKQAVQRNPLRHGLTARDAVIPDLDGPDAERDFERLRTALRRYYQPTDPLSDLDVDELAFLHWWRRRALRGLRGPVLKRLAAAEQTRADQASQRERDVSVLALVDKEALATSPDAIQSLLAILEEIRLEVDVLGVISERAREQLVAKFSVEPGGFVALCLTYTALAVLGPELVKEPERAGELPTAEQCKAAILALLHHQQERLHGLKETLEARAARHRELDQLVALRPEEDDERILEYYARFQRQTDRLRDRLDRHPVLPTLNVNLHGPE